MRLPKVLSTNLLKIFKIAGIAVLIVFLGYIVGRVWKISPEVFKQMPAALQPKEQPTQPEEKLKVEELPTPPSPEVPQPPQKVTAFREKAEKGEGLTHLARRALKEYLKENPQNFELTKEHKIYIEDYLAKALGYRWLQLGEEIEFKGELIQEAINKASQLTPQQLENLSQFAQLVIEI